MAPINATNHLRAALGASLASAILALLFQASGCAKATAAEPDRSSPTELELTVYKEDFALVHDTRSVSLSAGADQVLLPGVSKQLDPESVLFDWPTSGNHPEVVSTTYNVGVSSSQDLMKRLVGQNVDVVWRGQDGKESDRTTGRLEEAGQGTVLHTKDGYLIDPTGEVVVPGEHTFPTMPELVAKVQSPTQGAFTLGTSYLTRGLSWSADYVGSVAPDGRSMKLECWGTVSNQTGTDFPASKLKLVAGNPNRSVVAEHMAYSDASLKAADMSATPAGRPVMNTPAPVATGELYSYAIPAQADIRQGQMNRVRIFHAAIVPIVRTYSIALEPWVDSSQRRNAQVSISFTNGEGSGLGMPLPAGSLRAYDASGDAQAYIGAADLGDTPKDERVALTLSDAFDIYAKSKQTSFKRLNRRTASISFETVVHNEKKAPVSVRVVEQFQGPVKVLTESSKSLALNYSSREWKVTIPAGGQTTLNYTVQVRV